MSRRRVVSNLFQKVLSTLTRHVAISILTLNHRILAATSRLPEYLSVRVDFRVSRSRRGRCYF
jgi:hypothetical protein